MSIGKRGPKQTNPKKCFYAWLNTGTTDKAAKALAREGVLGRGGKPLHFNTIRRGAYLYVLSNPKETREIFRERMLFFALEDAMWDNFLIEKAKFVYAMNDVKAFYSWLYDNNLIGRAIEFGHVPPDFSIESVL